MRLRSLNITSCEIYSFSQQTFDDDKKEFYCDSELEINEFDLPQLERLIAKIPLPFSIVLDHNYVDKVYRDSFYRYFSSKHAETPRNCKRLAFFSGEVEYEDFYSVVGHQKLQANFIGFTVIRPIAPGAMGRTLIDPKKLNLPNGYLRTTTFDTVIMGAKLKVDAFPFSSQDTEIMTCAETSVWDLVEYYGTRYPEYKIIYPSDIANCLQKASFERSLPSRGLRFTQISILLKEFGFSPRIYFRGGGYNLNDFKRLFHYYVESGIPLVVGIEGLMNNQPTGHAIVCIGHGENNGAQVINEQNGLVFLDSADFVDNYFIMDDNQTPYDTGSFNQVVPYLTAANITGIVVPLYKRIFLDAADASSYIYEILTDADYGVLQALHNYVGEGAYAGRNNPLVVRIFLTSSRSFKTYRSVHSNQKLAHLYSNISLPKFIWVAEISTYDLFQKGEVFGEVIVDATATRYSYDKLIALHYPGLLGYREPNESEKVIFDMIKNSYYKDLANTYPMYINNLS